MDSFNKALDQYRGGLKELMAGRRPLPNRDFDTGRPTRAGEYALADDTYSKLARTLAEKRLASAPPAIVKNVLAFFRDPNVAIATKRHKSKWRDTVHALSQLAELDARQSSAAPVALAR